MVMKFSNKNTSCPVKFELQMKNDKLTMNVSHSILKDIVSDLKC